MVSALFIGYNYCFESQVDIYIQFTRISLLKCKRSTKVLLLCYAKTIIIDLGVFIIRQYRSHHADTLMHTCMHVLTRVHVAIWLLDSNIGYLTGKHIPIDLFVLGFM